MDLLYAALCKYYKAMTWEEFKDMDKLELINAIKVSAMPKEVLDSIWVVKRKAFEIF